MYEWRDYSCIYKALVDSWIDENAERFTGCTDGFDGYYQYWINTPETRLGENYWAKIIISDGEPIGVITLGLWDSIFIISEFIIHPDKRGKQLGSSALAELLTQSENIIGIKIKAASAVIFPNNIAAQKAFEKAGFTFHHAHTDGNALYYRWYNLRL